MNMNTVFSETKTINESDISNRIKILNDGKIQYMKKGYGWITTSKPLHSVKLELLFDESGLSQSEFGKIVGLTQPTLSRIISGKALSKSYLVDIALAFNISTEWLLCIADNPQPKLNDNILTLDNDKFVLIHAYNYDKSNSKTQNQDKSPYIILHTSSIKYNHLNSLRYTTQPDRSMTPDIKPGAAVVFSLDNKIIGNGEMYAIKIGNQNTVRTIFTDPAGNLILRAKMSDHPEYKVNPKDPNIKILGRVINVINTY